MKGNTWQFDQEYMEIVNDLIYREEVQRLKEHTHHFHTTRFHHSVAVSYIAYTWAKRLGLNAVSVARAGLLHDLFYYDWRTTKFKEGSHAYVHPRIACQNALKLTPLSEMEQDIIIKHMWLATIAFPKYKESYLVSIVDKYCALVEVSEPMRRYWSQRWDMEKATWRKRKEKWKFMNDSF